jgi:hypothetical protein
LFAAHVLVKWFAWWSGTKEQLSFCKQVNANVNEKILRLPFWYNPMELQGKGRWPMCINVNLLGNILRVLAEIQQYWAGW